jgi:hypothetical protein
VKEPSDSAVPVLQGGDQLSGLPAAVAPLQVFGDRSQCFAYELAFIRTLNASLASSRSQPGRV